MRMIPKEHPKGKVKEIKKQKGLDYFHDITAQRQNLGYLEVQSTPQPLK